ncbi:maltodextrin glucosidase [Deinococcus roseus]|uniref:Maltodextrin glucosidase n=1 Tax=Deinococcus roseus TaxID=392414 RepID=A0ABQ2DCU4_9DEIO|nr:maltodextrin glucosidase [Deinococcus roseus]GGJ53658.1 maltodextrin glucosidase [Deinococcus roseus]
MNLYHDGTPHFLIREGPHARVRLEAPPNLEQGWVVSYPGGDERLDSLQAGQENCWSGILPIQQHQKTHYRFKLILGGRVVWYNQGGVSFTPPAFGQDFSFSAQQPPEWVHSRVFYQIFPDRFCRGHQDRALPGHDYHGDPIIHKNWSDLPQKGQGHREIYGGDLEGIRQKIPYLQDLGVNALYLNPIFHSPSSHKYDTQDYHQIDPQFGSNEEFAGLVQQLHLSDIRIVLDGVFNHIGDHHPWMNRAGVYPEAGAFQNGSSRAYFTYTGERPEDYLGWAGVTTLPKLDFNHPEVQAQIYGRPDSVVRHWLKAPYGIDGWRLDVAPMLGKDGTDRDNRQILSEVWQAARDTHPEAYIFGEHFYDATWWLQGGVEDATMNYHGFTWPTWAFLAGRDHRNHPASVDAAQYAEALNRNLSQLPFRQQLAQLNLLGSHDTERFATVCADLEKQKIAAALLLTFIGVPCIYYGDEIGMEGENDPDCRRTMPWGDPQRWQHGLFDWYQQLIRLRKTQRALQEGSFRILHARGDHLVFERRLGQECIRVALTREAPLELPLEGHWQNLITQQNLIQMVTLPGPGVVVLRKEQA